MKKKHGKETEEISSQKNTSEFYYNREERKANSRLKRPMAYLGLGYFRTGKGKMTLIILFAGLISIIWMTQRIKSISGLQDGSFLNRRDIYFRLYAFKIEGKNEISIQFFIKNKDHEEIVYRFNRLYITVIDDKNDKVVFKKDFYTNVSVILGGKKTEVLSAIFPRAESRRIYYIRAVIIDNNNEKYLLNYRVNS